MLKKRSSYTMSLCLVLFLAACGPKVSKSWAPYEDAPAKESFWHSEEASGDASRTQASLDLTYKGRDLLIKGKHDDAIQTLERAISLDPANGQACYYMAESFLEKKNIKQAKEFHQLAQRYIGSEEQWTDRLNQQKKKIKIAMGNDLSYE